MAATIARATGYDSKRTKDVHRLGSVASRAEANTWRTFAAVYIEKDGSGYVNVARDGKLLYHWAFGPESKE